MRVSAALLLEKSVDQKVRRGANRCEHAAHDGGIAQRNEEGRRCPPQDAPVRWPQSGQRWDASFTKSLDKGT